MGGGKKKTNIKTLQEMTAVLHHQLLTALGNGVSTSGLKLLQTQKLENLQDTINCTKYLDAAFLSTSKHNSIQNRVKHIFP